MTTYLNTNTIVNSAVVIKALFSNANKAATNPTFARQWEEKFRPVWLKKEAEMNVIRQSTDPEVRRAAEALGLLPKQREVPYGFDMKTMTQYEPHEVVAHLLKLAKYEYNGVFRRDNTIAPLHIPKLRGKMFSLWANAIKVFGFDPTGLEMFCNTFPSWTPERRLSETAYNAHIIAQFKKCDAAHWGKFKATADKLFSAVEKALELEAAERTAPELPEQKYITEEQKAGVLNALGNPELSEANTKLIAAVKFESVEDFEACVRSMTPKFIDMNEKRQALDDLGNPELNLVDRVTLMAGEFATAEDFKGAVQILLENPEEEPTALGYALAAALS